MLNVSVFSFSLTGEGDDGKSKSPELDPFFLFWSEYIQQHNDNMKE